MHVRQLKTGYLLAAIREFIAADGTPDEKRAALYSHALPAEVEAIVAFAEIFAPDDGTFGH